MSNKNFDMIKYLKENRITLRELKYNTDKKKINFLSKKGNIVTFKNRINGRWQAVVTKLEKSRKSDKVKLHGELGFETRWFDDIDDLIDAIDWDFMEDSH